MHANYTFTLPNQNDMTEKVKTVNNDQGKNLKNLFSHQNSQHPSIKFEYSNRGEVAFRTAV